MQLKMFQDEVIEARKKFKEYVALNKEISNVLWENKYLQRVELRCRIENYFRIA